MSSLNPSPSPPVTPPVNSYDLPCTIVIKIGTSSIIHEESDDIQLARLRDVASTVTTLRNAGFRVVLVSSGAVGLGLLRTQRRTVPRRQSGKQALAAVGQGEMISMWSEIFAESKTPVAQILLTHEDLSSPKRCDSAIRTFNELFSIGVVPIVNENDTLSTKELRIGDNDTLSAVTATMVQASFLFLLTDVDSLYATNPKYDPHAASIAFVTSVSSLRKNIDTDLGAGTPNGTGGMETKLRAAEIASAAGFFTVIASSAKPGIVTEILDYYKAQRLLSGAPEFKSLPDDSSESEDDARPPHTIFLPNTNVQFASPFAVGEALTPSSS